MNTTHNKTKRHILIAVLAIAFFGCANHGDRYGNNQTPNTDDINVSTQTPGMSYNGANSDGDATQGAPLPATPAIQRKPTLIKIYVENSESIFGYVRDKNDPEETNYVDVLNEIEQLPDFISQRIPIEISFVNGANPIRITPLGNSFGDKLNRKGMRCGDITLSDLNVMFDTVLANATNGTISILISDGIYDIGKNSTIGAEGKKTRSAFIKRLENTNEDIQTLLIKLSSLYNYNYFYASKKGHEFINNKQRPYYIWIIGESDLVNNYFSDATITKRLKGYQEHVRYVKLGKDKLPFEIDGDSEADIVIDPNDSHTLTRHRAYHGQFKLNLIVDFYKLIYSDNYLQDVNNYLCNFNFHLVSVEKANQTVLNSNGVSHYQRPFIITLETSQPNPVGKLTLKLKNNEPRWIINSNADNEIPINDSTTYGFATLTKGIREAYEYVSDSIPAIFDITFK